MIKILITAGGTSEKIDNVRRITNSGTGRLGARIAEAFTSSGLPCSIVYICTENAARPPVGVEAVRGTRIETMICGDVNSVKEAVCEACAGTDFDVIVHSMAIGDYRVKAVLDSLLSQNEIRESKISSDREELVVVLEKAPKIIALLRGLAPGAVIVGFKLLSDAAEEELLEAARALLINNDCDFVLANDMKAIQGDSHEGVLLSRDGAAEHAAGKEEIAALIVRRVLDQLSKKGRS